jgi:hypothetical protein
MFALKQLLRQLEGEILKHLKRAMIIGSFLLGACAPVSKANALPRKSDVPRFTKLTKTEPEKTGRIRKITNGNVEYSLQGYNLSASSGSRIKVVCLKKTFQSAGIIPDLAHLRMDKMPPKMKMSGSLLYVYSPGAKGIAIINPKTREQIWISVSTEIQALVGISFEVKNGIIAISGAGADFIGVISLGDLCKSEASPIVMSLEKLFADGYSHLVDPKMSISGNRIYVCDKALGAKRYFFEVINGIALPITVEAD